LVDKVQCEFVLVRADLVADTTLPRTGQTVQRGVQEVHAALEEENAAVLAAEQSPLTHVVGQDVVERRESSDRLRVLDCLVLGGLDVQAVCDGR